MESGAGEAGRPHPVPSDRFRQAQSLEQAQLGSIEALAAVKAIALPPPALAPADTVSAAVLAAEGRPAVAYRQAGDGYILMEYGDNVLDLALRLRIHLLMQSLRQEAIPGVAELAPGVRSLQIRYDSRLISQADLLQRLLARERALGDVSRLKVPTRTVWLPMAFEDSATLGRSIAISRRYAPRRLAAEQRRFYSAHQRPEPTRTGARHPVRRQLPDPRIGRRLPRRALRGAARSAPSPAELQIQPGAHPHRRRDGRHRRHVHVHLRHGFAGRLPTGGAHAADLEQIPQKPAVHRR